MIHIHVNSICRTSSRCCRYIRPRLSIYRYSATSDLHNDDKPKSWVESSVIPNSLRPYLYLARADKPVGTMLLLWPCAWSICLAAPMGSLPDAAMLIKFGIGAFIMRGAGCVINDMWDQRFDRHVERTKNRPIASGEVSNFQALQFLAAQLTCGLGVLISLNQPSIVLGAASLPLVCVYPLMKRFTHWPQLVLGLTFNWGALLGWTAVTGSLSLSHTLPLYLSGVCWTLVYDTIYGYQDRKDDARLGLKSTSLYLGDKPQWALTAIGGGMMTGLCAAGIISSLSWPFYISVAGVGAHGLWQIWTADVDDRGNLWDRFSSNQYAGALVTAGIVAGHF